MKKNISKNKFVYNYKYIGADKRSLILFFRKINRFLKFIGNWL